MKLSRSLPVKELAEMLGAELHGDASLTATGINEIHHVEPGDITFVDVRKYFEKALHSSASIILINELAPVPDGKALLLVADPFAAYNRLVWQERPLRPVSTTISPTAKIGQGTIIEHGAIIADGVVIGDDCYIQSQAVILEGTRIGHRVTLQPGCIIGSDAFYYKKTAEGFHKWRSGGGVVIEDDVEIGAACTINRGVSSDTVIGAGTKLDCQVQIGHDVKIGRRCLLAAQVGVAGNCVLEDEVVLYGQVGIAQNLRIGAKAVVMAKSGVSKDLPGGKAYFGYPAKEARTAYREIAALRQLGEK